MASRVDNISANLHVALRAHSRATHEDVAIALLEHARTTILSHRQTLKELEALKPEITRIGESPSANGQRPPPPANLAPTHTYHPDLRPPPPLVNTVPSHQDGTRSMVLPPPPPHSYVNGQSTGLARSQSSDINGRGLGDPLADQQPGMVQSMMLPGQRPQSQTAGRGGARRLDERMAAKLLAGGF